jgi:serine/threonine-protein kinase/endoribonuclease IRE1
VEPPPREPPPLVLFEPDGCPSAANWALMRDIGAGLAALHADGVIHRDLKPHNVLLTPGGRAKLSDLGLSRALSPGEASSHAGDSAGPGAGAGTAGWRAPERLQPGDRQGRAVDTWALGCLLHYCLTGGGHPWGAARLHRDAAVARGAPADLSRLAAMPEARHLLVRPFGRGGGDSGGGG